MAEMIPRSRIVRIEFECVIPESATREQVGDWVRYETGCGSCDEGNPLLNWDLEALTAPVLSDTGRHLHEEVIDNGNGTYTTKRLRKPEPFTGERASDAISRMAMAKRGVDPSLPHSA